MGTKEDMAELESKRTWALAMGGPARVARQHARGRLTARERIEKLMDPGTFFETGMLTHAPEPEWAQRTPGDGLICGYGKIGGHIVAVSATDSTVLGGSDGSEAAGRKNGRVSSFSHDQGYPHIELGEGGGGRIHNLMGWAIARGTGGGGVGGQKSGPPENRVPLLTAVLGNSYGGSSFRVGSSDWVVMTKGSSISISSPGLIEASIGEKVTNEELGGWELHARRTGQVDMVTDTEEEALLAVREMVGYLPSRASESPPVCRTGDDPRRRDEGLLTVVPENANRAFDMTRIIRRVVDDGKYLLIKPEFGKCLVCCLARLDGHTVGIVANNSLYQAGAIDVDGAVKMARFVTLCNTFNVPLLFFHDVPGVLIGKNQEAAGVVSKIMDVMGALSACKVPRLAVIIRKSYGLAYVAMSGSWARNTFTFAWPSARIGFMAPEAGVRVAYGRQLAEQGLSKEQLEAKYQELMGDWERTGLPWEAAGAGYIDDVIDPRDTRWTLVRALEVALGHLY
ncbi:MAG: carboxyl transferase [Dehalococcoidia bacterium]|nr:carboxyl transferase [Dehalococcoidia bacterium]